MKKENRFLIAVFSLIFTAILAYFDYITGPNVSLRLFYLVPIFLIGWFVSLSANLVLIVLISILSYFDQFKPYKYSAIITEDWNYVAGMIFFILFVVLFEKLKKSIISERKRRLELQTIIDTSLDGFWLVDGKGSFLRVNDAFCRISGYNRQELLKMRIEDIEAIEDPDDIKKRVNQIKIRGSDLFETKHRRKDGKIINVEVSVTCLKNCDYFFVFLRDITGRKKEEKELMRLASFPELNPLPVCEVDLNGNFVYKNPAANNLFYGIEKAGFEHPWINGLDAIFNLFLQGELNSYKREIRLQNNYYQQVIQYLPEDRHVRVYGFDVTDRHKIEEILRDSSRIKTEFINIVSHELRTPLAAIKEGISLVLEHVTGDLNPNQESTLQLVKNNVDRLARLVNEILDYQKIDSGKIEFKAEINDINQVAREVSETMSALAKKKNLKFTLKLDEKLPRIRFDYDKITQVLTNLINNAIKFTEKGSITLATAKREDAIQISIKDTGIGIKKEDLLKVFEQFTQLHQSDGGAGLGLAISRLIIEGHKGKIWVESEFGKGSTFHFILPI